MKKCFFGMIGVCLCLLLAACAKQGAGQETSPLTVSTQKELFYQQSAPSYTPGEFQFKLMPGEYFGESIVEGDTVYFESGNYIDTDVVISAAICKWDEDGTEILHTEEREDGGAIEVNELKMTENSLFWVYSDPEEWAIRAYDLTRKETQTIETYEPDEIFVLILESDDRFLTWYAVPQEGKPSLYVYDTESKEIKCLSNDIGYDNPYTRANVVDGVTSYIENCGGQGKRIVVFDLENDRELGSYLLPEAFTMADVQANREYVVVRKGYETTGMYLLDTEKNELREIDYSVHAGIYPFSWHLMGDKVFINSKGRDQFHDELVILSLKDSTLSWIPLGQSVVGGKVREPDQFSAEFSSVDEDGVVTAHIVYYRFPG